MIPTDFAVSAIENNLHGLFGRFGLWKGARVDDRKQWLSLSSEVPVPVFNSVLRARLPVRGAERAIDEALASREALDVPLLWWTGPSTTPVDLPARLVARGFVGGTIPGMAIDLARGIAMPPAIEGFTVARVDGSAALMRWCRTVIRGFSFPDEALAPFHQFGSAQGFDERSPYRSYVGKLGRKVVATSSLFIEGDVAGIYSVSVLPEARRRGIGAHMTAIPLAAARADGCRIGILHSSSLGVSVYRGLGFTEYCRIGQYVWSPRRTR